MIEILIVGIAIGFNFIILKWKYDHKRYNDLAMDLTVLGLLAYFFGGTILGMAGAMVGGMLVSIYLLFSHTGDDNDDTYKPKQTGKPRPKIHW